MPLSHFPLDRPFVGRETIDVNEEIANAPLRSYHVFLATLVALVVFFDGYDSFNASYVIHYVMGPWKLTAGSAGLLVSSGLVGFMLGSLFQGKFSDRFGRRVTLLSALWIATIFSFATGAFGHDLQSFCGFRFLTGLGLGTLLPLGVTYMNEFAPKKFLNSFSMWGWTLGFAGGGTAASVVGIYLTPRFGWQSLYYFASLSVVLVVICHWVLPESVKFLALKGRDEEARNLLSKLRPNRQTAYMSPNAIFVLPESKDRTASLSLLLSDGQRRTTLLIWATAFCILFAIYGLTGWVPSAMIRRGESFATSFSLGALIQGMGFIGALFCGFVADRFHNFRRAMGIWWFLGAICIGTLGFVNTHLLNFLCIGAAGFFILGGQGVLNNYTASSVETEVRATAVGMMLGVGRVGGILGPFVLGLVQQVSPNAFTLFLVIAGAAMFGLIMIAAITPHVSTTV